MKKIIISLCAVCCAFPFLNTEKAMGAIDARTGASELTTPMTVSYTEAKGYFVSNNLDSLPPSVITSEAELNKYFGMATVMGKNGKPTEIDFNKKYVIDVTLPVTDTATVMKPKSLKKAANGDLTFTYVIKRGEKQSYSVQPLLMIIVDKKHSGKVVLKAIEK